MTKRSPFLVATALLALAVPALAGQPGRPGPFRGPGGPGFEGLDERLDQRAERLADALDLTAEQRAAFDQLRDDAMAAAEPKMERMRTAGEELRTLLEADTGDATAVGNLVLEMHRLRAELRASRQQVEQGLEALLTDAQKLALNAVRETRPRPRRFDGAGPGGPPPAWLGGPAD